MHHRHILCAALLVACFYVPLTHAQSGTVVVLGANRELSAQSLSTSATFTMAPSVVTSGARNEQTLQFDTACILLPFNVIVPNCNLTIRWEVQAFSGGHIHHTNRPPGIFTTANGITGGSIQPGPRGDITDNTGATGILGVTYTAPEAAGTTSFTLTGVAVVGGQVVRFGPDTFTIDVEVGGLEFITVPGLAVARESNMHDQHNGHANAGTIGALGAMTQTFAAELVRQNRAVPLVRITAASLPKGGLFDFRDEWRPPHRSHRFGSDLDVGIRELVVVQRQALVKALYRAGFATPVRNERPQDPASTHWHLRLP